MKLEDVRFKWTSGMACIEGFTLENIYHLVIKNNKMYVSDGNLEIKIEEGALKNIFTPINDVLWADVEFSEVKTNKK
jgi:hypothetical protein